MVSAPRRKMATGSADSRCQTIATTAPFSPRKPGNEACQNEPKATNAPCLHWVCRAFPSHRRRSQVQSSAGISGLNLCRSEERIRPPHRARRAFSTRPVGRSLGRHVSASLMRSGVNGVCRKRAPVSWAIALPIAGVTNGVAICPTPVGELSVDITSMCIGGTSLMRGIR
jgi:hypothetical protein